MRLSVNLSSACERVSMAQVSRQERPFGGWQVARPAAAASTPADAWREWRRARLRRRLRHHSGSGSGYASGFGCGSMEGRRRGQRRGRREERWRHSVTRRRSRASAGRASRARARPTPRQPHAPETRLSAADTSKA